jgi:hypothetical protein
MKYKAAQADVFDIPLYNTSFQSSWVKIYEKRSKHEMIEEYVMWRLLIIQYLNFYVLSTTVLSTSKAAK